jgi:hypothetical protein
MPTQRLLRDDARRIAANVAKLSPTPRGED